MGQGDSILIRTCSADILIDTGPNTAEEKLRAYLDQCKVKTLNICLFTHPDEDHIGNADAVISDYTVENILMPPIFSDNLSYSLLMSEAGKKGITPQYVLAGSTYCCDRLEMTVLSPITDDIDDVNEGSVVLRIQFGNTVLIFMADAGTDTEEFITAAYSPEYLNCDLLKVGHHGSSSSTGTGLLEATAPEIAVISCGKNNSFGHPHASVLARLEKYGSEIYRTDISGTLVFVSDGENITLK